MTDQTFAMRPQSGIAGLFARLHTLMACIPYWFVALVARVSIAATNPSRGAAEQDVGFGRVEVADRRAGKEHDPAGRGYLR